MGTMPTGTAWGLGQCPRGWGGDGDKVCRDGEGMGTELPARGVDGGEHSSLYSDLLEMTVKAK